MSYRDRAKLIRLIGDKNNEIDKLKSEVKVFKFICAVLNIAIVTLLWQIWSM